MCSTFCMAVVRTYLKFHVHLPNQTKHKINRLSCKPKRLSCPTLKIFVSAAQRKRDKRNTSMFQRKVKLCT